MTDKEFLKDIHSLLDNNEINGTWLYEIGVENQETGEIMGGFLSLTPPKQHLNEKMENQYWLSAIDVVFLYEELGDYLKNEHDNGPILKSEEE